MSLASWILDRITGRRGKRRRDSELHCDQEVQLYLRRLEDRRVLSVTAVEDAYFVDEMDLSFSTSPQAGVLSNDFHSAGAPLFAQGGTFATAQGGTVSLNADGSFDYFSPFAPGTIFVDQFTYAASDGTSTSLPTNVKLFVGEVPIDFSQSTMIPIFSVETAQPNDLVQVNLSASAGGSLTLLNTANINFNSGANGDSEISISGTARDVNKALDQLKYTPPTFYGGTDEIIFDYDVIQGSPVGETEIVPLVANSSTRTLFAVDDHYYVDPAQSIFFASRDAGLLSNDYSTEPESFFFMVTNTATTELGGTVEINFDGSFTYTPPNLPGGQFVDSFVYTMSNEIDFTSAIATLYVGEVPVQEDLSARLALFTVDSLTQQDFATVALTSAQGSSLTLLNTFGIVFDAGANGQSSITFSGFVRDVNAAFDSLIYTPPFNYSGPDMLSFSYEFISQQQLGGGGGFQAVPIQVEPIADPPLLFVSPNPVQYSVGEFAPVDIDVLLTDVDGSEIPGLIILSSVPTGVVPNAGQPSPADPGMYFILPSDLAGLAFLVDAAAPANFTIFVTATSIETTDQPGAFGGPGGPLLPRSLSDPRFAFTSQALSFVRLTKAAPPPESVIQLGPLSPPPGPPRPPGPKGPPLFAGLITVNGETQSNNQTTTIIVFTDGPNPINNDSGTGEEQKNEPGAGSFEGAGIYVRKIGGEGPGQFARLPEELSDNYARFMQFLRNLPNGDYVVYFKRGGQTHEQAAARQVVVKVRVVNHRLNPDPGEFKPAGEVAEPPQDPNMHPIATENPEADESTDALDWAEPSDVEVSAISGDDNGPEDDEAETPAISAAAWVAAVAGWKFRIHRKSRTARIDRRMERFSKRRRRMHAH